MKINQNENPSNNLPELEKGEVILSPKGILSKIRGKSHNQGGEFVDIEEGSKIYSSKIKLPKQVVSVIEEKPLNKVKKTSPADLASKFDTSKYLETLRNTSADKYEKNTAQLMLGKNQAKLEAIMTAQEEFKKIKGVKEGVLLEDQGLDENLNPIYQLGGQFQTGSQNFKPTIVPWQNEYRNSHSLRNAFQVEPTDLEQLPTMDNNPNYYYYKKGNSVVIRDPVSGRYSMSNAKRGDLYFSKNNLVNLFQADDKGRTTFQNEAYSKQNLVDGFLHHEDLKGLDEFNKSDGRVVFQSDNLQAIPGTTNRFKGKDFYSGHEFVVERTARGGYKVIRDTPATNYNPIKVSPIIPPPASPQPAAPTAVVPATAPVTPKSPPFNTTPFATDPYVVTPNFEPIEKKEIPQIPLNKTEVNKNALKSDRISSIILEKPKLLQEQIQKSYLDYFMRTKGTPYLQNPNMAVSYQKNIPINALVGERQMSNTTRTMNNSDMSANLAQAAVADTISKVLENQSATALQNYQGQLNVDNANSQMYANTYNNLEKSRDAAMNQFVGQTQIAQDQFDTEGRNILNKIDQLRLQKSDFNDQAAQQKFLAIEADKRFYPVYRGKGRFDLVLNPNAGRLKQESNILTQKDRFMEDYREFFKLTGNTTDAVKMLALKYKSSDRDNKED